MGGLTLTTSKTKHLGQTLRCTPLVPVLWRWVDLCELQASQGSTIRPCLNKQQRLDDGRDEGLWISRTTGVCETETCLSHHHRVCGTETHPSQPPTTGSVGQKHVPATTTGSVGQKHALVSHPPQVLLPTGPQVQASHTQLPAAQQCSDTEDVESPSHIPRT